MTVADRMAALVARVPELARTQPVLEDFWREVDAEMERILPLVESDADQRVLDDHYSVLMERVDVMGLMQSGVD